MCRNQTSSQLSFHQDVNDLTATLHRFIRSRVRQYEGAEDVDVPDLGEFLSSRIAHTKTYRVLTPTNERQRASTNTDRGPPRVRAFSPRSTSMTLSPRSHPNGASGTVPENDVVQAEGAASADALDGQGELLVKAYMPRKVCNVR